MGKWAATLLRGPVSAFSCLPASLAIMSSSIMCALAPACLCFPSCLCPWTLLAGPNSMSCLWTHPWPLILSVSSWYSENSPSPVPPPALWTPSSQQPPGGLCPFLSTCPCSLLAFSLLRLCPGTLLTPTCLAWLCRVPYPLVLGDSSETRNHVRGRQVAPQEGHEACRQAGSSLNPNSATRAWVSHSAACSSLPQNWHLVPSWLGFVKMNRTRLVKGLEQGLACNKCSINSSWYLYYSLHVEWVCESMGKFWAASCPDDDLSLFPWRMWKL